jgi:predicted nucleic acid-binding protein
LLVDTNILLRTLQPHHTLYPAAAHALGRLLGQGQELNVVPQNFVELWVVATRPLPHNGLGLTPEAAAAEVSRLQGMFVVLPETPALFPAWQALVTRHRVSGKAAHEARLVAAMQVHGVTAILTFDKAGFSRVSRPGCSASGRRDLTGDQNSLLSSRDLPASPRRANVRDMTLSYDQRLWLLTAHPDTWELGEAPEWLAAECENKGLVAHISPNVLKLTPEGHKQWRALRGDS